MNPFHISLDPSKPEFWIAAGLIIFLGIVVFVAKAPQMIAGRLDAQRDAIQNDLDEAARIRAEAERLLAELKAERVEAEKQVRDMLAAAEERPGPTRPTPRPGWTSPWPVASSWPNGRSPTPRPRPKPRCAPPPWTWPPSWLSRSWQAACRAERPTRLWIAPSR